MTKNPAAVAPSKKTQRAMLVVRVTLPDWFLIDDSYIADIAEAVQKINPHLKGQRITVQYQGDERA
jgi:hypothetical protein